MNKVKGLKVMITIAVMLATLVSYLGWRNEQLNQELVSTQHSLQVTLEKYNALQNEFMAIQESLQVESEKTVGLNNEINKILEELNNVNTKLEDANTTISVLQNNEYELVYVGDYKITYYCDERYDHQCGGNGLTAMGTPTVIGVSAAADWSVLPKGSTVYINGIGWREIQDVGGSVKGKHIDVLVETHSEALDLGMDYEGVWLLVKKGS